MSDPYIVLHGGFHKTATSHVQSILSRNAKMIRRSGVQYVHHRDTRKQLTVPCQYNTYIKLGMDWDPVISDEELAVTTGAFFRDLAKEGAKRIIISDENIAGHCGHCIKRGLLYRWHRKILEVFSSQFPWPVRELHLSVRNYADFFSAAYVEYLRSVSSTAFLDEPKMRLQIMNNMPNWYDVLKSMMEFFPEAKLIVWKYEDFRKMEQDVLANLCGSDVDVSRLKSPSDKNKRPTASGRAVEELLQVIHNVGAEEALNQWQAIQEKFPRGEDYGNYSPWSEFERAHLSRMYEKDVEDIRNDPNIHFLSVESPRPLANDKKTRNSEAAAH